MLCPSCKHPRSKLTLYPALHGRVELEVADKFGQPHARREVWRCGQCGAVLGTKEIK
jgi:hypothetical protein